MRVATEALICEYEVHEHVVLNVGQLLRRHALDAAQLLVDVRSQASQRSAFLSALVAGPEELPQLGVVQHAGCLL